jgi:hypothetical protein
MRRVVDEKKRFRLPMVISSVVLSSGLSSVVVALSSGLVLVVQVQLGGT